MVNDKTHYSSFVVCAATACCLSCDDDASFCWLNIWSLRSISARPPPPARRAAVVSISINHPINSTSSSRTGTQWQRGGQRAAETDVYTRAGPDITSPRHTNSSAYIALYPSRLAAAGQRTYATPTTTGNTWRRRAEVPTPRGSLTAKRRTSPERRRRLA